MRLKQVYVVAQSKVRGI